MNPLNNHRHSLILGIVLALVLTVLIGGFHLNQLGLARWFHIVSGVFWIGLLYYFNVAHASSAPSRSATAWMIRRITTSSSASAPGSAPSCCSMSGE
jgi:hypothetical protein